MASLKSYNSGTIKGTRKTFAPNRKTGDFRGQAIKRNHSNLRQIHPCCHGNNL